MGGPAMTGSLGDSSAFAAQLGAMVDTAMEKVLAAGRSPQLLYNLRLLQEEQFTLRATLEVDEAEFARLWRRIVELEDENTRLLANSSARQEQQTQHTQQEQMLVAECNSLRQQLAAAQGEVKRLRAALAAGQAQREQLTSEGTEARPSAAQPLERRIAQFTEQLRQLHSAEARTVQAAHQEAAATQCQLEAQVNGALAQLALAKSPAPGLAEAPTAVTSAALPDAKGLPPLLAQLRRDVEISLREELQQQLLPQLRSEIAAAVQLHVEAARRSMSPANEARVFAAPSTLQAPSGPLEQRALAVPSQPAALELPAHPAAAAASDQPPALPSLPPWLADRQEQGLAAAQAPGHAGQADPRQQKPDAPQPNQQQQSTTGQQQGSQSPWQPPQLLHQPNVSGAPGASPDSDEAPEPGELLEMPSNPSESSVPAMQQRAASASPSSQPHAGQTLPAQQAGLLAQHAQAAQPAPGVRFVPLPGGLDVKSAATQPKGSKAERTQLQQILASGLFWCPPCRVSFGSLGALAQHHLSASHDAVVRSLLLQLEGMVFDKGNLKRVSAPTVPRTQVGNNKYACAFCSIVLHSSNTLLGHLLGKGHRAKVQAAAAQARRPAPAALPPAAKKQKN